MNRFCKLDFQLRIRFILGAKLTNVCLAEPVSQSTFKVEMIGYFFINSHVLSHFVILLGRVTNWTLFSSRTGLFCCELSNPFPCPTAICLWSIICARSITLIGFVHLPSSFPPFPPARLMFQSGVQIRANCCLRNSYSQKMETFVHFIGGKRVTLKNR